MDNFNNEEALPISKRKEAFNDCCVSTHFSHVFVLEIEYLALIKSIQFTNKTCQMNFS